MTEEQKNHIKNNIDLINEANWNKFFENAPHDMGSILYKAGIDFMQTMEEVPRFCFYDTDLDIIDIPEGVKILGLGAFASASNLTNLTIPNTVTHIGDDSFRLSGLKNITIPNSVTSIGYRAFYECTSLTSITIPDSVTFIDMAAFSYCSNLTNITIPDSVTHLGSEALARCSSLTSINLSQNISNIDYHTFSYCSSLESINIPYSVKNINKGAFINCASLKTIIFTGTTEQWREITQGKDSFKNVPARRVICSDGVTKLR